MIQRPCLHAVQASRGQYDVAYFMDQKGYTEKATVSSVFLSAAAGAEFVHKIAHPNAFSGECS
jgi:hypothetical protein